MKKRIFVIASILLTAVSLSAKHYPDSVRQAGAEETYIAYGWNFEFAGGAGVGHYLFDQVWEGYVSPRVTNKIQFPSWTAGVGINYYFVPAMGIGTGAQLTVYNNNSVINKPWVLNAADTYGDTYVLTATPTGLTEQQEIYMLEVPLALKFRARPGVVGFTGTLGAKIGLPIKNSYKLSAGSVNNSVYYEKYDLTITNVPGVVEDKPIAGVVTAMPKSAFQTLSYAAYIELGMLIRLHQRVDLAISAYGNYYFNDIQTTHPATALGFATTGSIGEYPEPYTAPYNGVLNTNEVRSLHPWSAGLKIGIQINANRTNAEREYDREQKRLKKEAEAAERALRDSLAEVARLEALAALEAAKIAEPEPEPVVVPVVVPIVIEEEIEEEPDTIPVEPVEPLIDPRIQAIEAIKALAAEYDIDICQEFCPQTAIVPMIMHDTIYVTVEGAVPEGQPVIIKTDTVARMLEEELKKAVIYFELDKAVPILEPADILERIAEVLKRHPDKKIHVNGHACKLGKPEYNKRLALRRAKAVAAKLRKLGVKDDQMIIASLGSEIPYRYNGKHQLSKDRRVEIIPACRMTEVVRPGSRLAQIARRHYGNPDYWVYIYEANKDQITNPSDLPVGIELIIPDISEIQAKKK